MILRNLRLSTGEDIVGNITEDTEEYLSIENPCILIPTLNEDHEQTINMSPFLIFSDQKILKIKKHFIMYDVGVANQLQSKYNEIYAPSQYSIHKKL